MFCRERPRTRPGACPPTAAFAAARARETVNRPRTTMPRPGTWVAWAPGQSSTPHELRADRVITHRPRGRDHVSSRAPGAAKTRSPSPSSRAAPQTKQWGTEKPGRATRPPGHAATRPVPARRDSPRHDGPRRSTRRPPRPALVVEAQRLVERGSGGLGVSSTSAPPNSCAITAHEEPPFPEPSGPRKRRSITMAILAPRMRAARLRLYLIVLLVVAAILSVVGNKSHSPLIGWLSFAVFLGALALYVTWRRAALSERRGRVFDREAKTTDADRTRSDQ